MDWEWMSASAPERCFAIGFDQRKPYAVSGKPIDEDEATTEHDNTYTHLSHIQDVRNLQFFENHAQQFVGQRK